MLNETNTILRQRIDQIQYEATVCFLSLQNQLYALGLQLSRACVRAFSYLRVHKNMFMSKSIDVLRPRIDHYVYNNNDNNNLVLVLRTYIAVFVLRFMKKLSYWSLIFTSGLCT